MKINNEKSQIWTPSGPQFWEGSSAASPLKICDVMPP